MSIDLFPQSNDWHRGPTELVQHFACRVSSHRRKGAARQFKIGMVWLYRSPFPLGIRGVFLLFKWFLPAFVAPKGGVGSQHPVASLQYMRREGAVERQLPLPDCRVHACLYFIPPSGHGLRHPAGHLITCQPIASILLIMWHLTCQHHQNPKFFNFQVQEPRNRFHGIDSASLCNMAGPYDNPIPTWFLSLNRFF